MAILELNEMRDRKSYRYELGIQGVVRFPQLPLDEDKNLNSNLKPVFHYE